MEKNNKNIYITDLAITYSSNFSYCIIPPPEINSCPVNMPSTGPIYKEEVREEIVAYPFVGSNGDVRYIGLSEKVQGTLGIIMGTFDTMSNEIRELRDTMTKNQRAYSALKRDHEVLKANLKKYRDVSFFGRLKLLFKGRP